VWRWWYSEPSSISVWGVRHCAWQLFSPGFSFDSLPSPSRYQSEGWYHGWLQKNSFPCRGRSVIGVKIIDNVNNTRKSSEIAGRQQLKSLPWCHVEKTYWRWNCSSSQGVKLTL
jgi:hypothetical protein